MIVAAPTLAVASAKPVEPSAPAVESGDVLFGIKRPGFLRFDNPAVRAWNVTGDTAGYGALEDAIAAAKTIVAKDTPSIAVLREGDRFSLRYLMIEKEHPRFPITDKVEFRMPQLQDRDTFRNVNDALQAIIDLSNGVVTRERVAATV
jgi:hypothetical protein